MLTQTPNIVSQPFYTACLWDMRNIVCKEIIEKMQVSAGQWTGPGCQQVKWRSRYSLSLSLPHSGRCDGSNKENPAPAEWVRRLEDEDVLEEERV